MMLYFRYADATYAATLIAIAAAYAMLRHAMRF